MKKNFFFFFLALSLVVNVHAQGLKGFMKKVSQDSSNLSISNVFNKVSSTSKTGLSTETIASGLKEALQVGTEKGAAKLSGVNGFFKDAAIKILMPAEAQKVEQKLRSIGLGSQVDNAILSMNRAAEDASKSAVPVFVNAIKQMSIQDAVGILKGGDYAATDYLKSKTTINLTEAFRPIILQSLEKVNATKYWNSVFSTYNKFSLEKINTDISAYVTEKALAGMFHQVALEEQKIRKDPMAQTTDLLKKVFGK